MVCTSPSPEWAILGNYQDGRERLARCREESELTPVTCQFHNLPEDLSARLEYLEGFGAEGIQQLAGEGNGGLWA